MKKVLSYEHNPSNLGTFLDDFKGSFLADWFKQNEFLKWRCCHDCLFLAEVLWIPYFSFDAFWENLWHYSADFWFLFVPCLWFPMKRAAEWALKWVLAKQRWVPTFPDVDQMHLLVLCLPPRSHSRWTGEDSHTVELCFITYTIFGFLIPQLSETDVAWPQNAVGTKHMEAESPATPVRMAAGPSWGPAQDAFHTKEGPVCAWFLFATHPFQEFQEK